MLMLNSIFKINKISFLKELMKSNKITQLNKTYQIVLRLSFLLDFKNSNRLFKKKI